jgi:6-phosphofructokinase 1
VRFLKGGGTGCTIISDAQDIQSIPFSEFIDASGQSKVRKVDINSHIYQVARKYMIRLEPDDFEGKQLRRLASITCLDAEAFQRRFASAVI